MEYGRSSTVTISKKINLGFVVAFLMVMSSIYVVITQKVKPDLIAQRQQQLEISQQDMASLLGAKLEQIQLLTSSLALSAQELPKDEVLFKQVFPPVIDNHGDTAIAGGGIWPEPGMFTPDVTRRSFFWGRSNGTLSYVDDYNKPDGNGYHNESWYQVGRQGQPGKCNWSEAYTDTFTKTPMITCTVPMQAQGQFQGVATVDMMLGGITAILKKYGEEQGGYAFALDQTGQVISFPHDLLKAKSDGSMVKIGEIAQLLPWFSEAASHLSSLDTHDAVQLENDAILNGAAYVDMLRLPGTGWTIGVVVPESKMTSLASNMGLFLMLSVGCSLLVMLVVGFYFFRGVLAQIKQTTRQIENLAHGNVGQDEALAIVSYDEVGQLRLSVNHYADKLKGMLQQIQSEASALLNEATHLNNFSNDFLKKA